jgi:hypothetical protein
MKSNKKTKKRKTQHYRTRQYKNTNNKTKNKKQYGGTLADTITTVNNVANDIDNRLQQGQNAASSTDSSQEPGDGVPGIIKDAGDENSGMGKIVDNVLNSDSDSDSDPDSQKQSKNQQQSAEKSEQLQKYLQYIQNNPNFIQSAFSNILVKPAAHVINELGSLLNITMNNPQHFQTQLDEMADSIQDEKQREKVLNYNAQILAVYLSASKPSVDIISGIFAEEFSEMAGDIIYNMSTKIQNMIPIFAIPQLFNEMLMSISQLMTTLSQLTSTGFSSIDENLQQFNRSIMNETNVKNKLIAEQKIQADILEKQNKLVNFILENPKVINFYIQYLNEYQDKDITINDIIPNSSEITDPNLEPNLDSQGNSTSSWAGAGGKRKTNTRTPSTNKDYETILNAIRDSLNDYNKNQSK